MKKIGTLILSLLTLFSFTVNAHENHYRPYLKVEEVREEGLLLKLDDGSEWDIQHFSGLWKIFGYGKKKNVSHWAADDLIEIKYPATGNLFDFQFVISNLSKDEEALAILKIAPSITHGSCLWIVDYNEKDKQFTLNNGTVWVIKKKKRSSPHWFPGDPITLLTSEGYFNKDKIMCWNHANNEIHNVKPLHY